VLLWHFIILVSLSLIICAIVAYIDSRRAKAHNQTDKTLWPIHADLDIYETTVELTLDVTNSENVEQNNTKDANESEIVMEQDITFIHTDESIDR